MQHMGATDWLPVFECGLRAKFVGQACDCGRVARHLPLPCMQGQLLPVHAYGSFVPLCAALTVCGWLQPAAVPTLRVAYLMLCFLQASLCPASFVAAQASSLCRFLAYGHGACARGGCRHCCVRQIRRSCCLVGFVGGGEGGVCALSVLMQGCDVLAYYLCNAGVIAAAYPLCAGWKTLCVLLSLSAASVLLAPAQARCGMFVWRCTLYAMVRSCYSQPFLPAVIGVVVCKTVRQRVCRTAGSVSQVFVSEVSLCCGLIVLAAFAWLAAKAMCSVAQQVACMSLLLLLTISLYVLFVRPERVKDQQRL